MFNFQLELIGGPGDGWRSVVSTTPGRSLRVRLRSETVEILLPGESPRAGRLAEYRFRDVNGISHSGPSVSLRYDFRRFVIDTPPLRAATASTLTPQCTQPPPAVRNTPAANSPTAKTPAIDTPAITPSFPETATPTPSATLDCQPGEFAARANQRTGAWRRLLATLRTWLLAEIDYPFRTPRQARR